jgi:predicted Fe-Mo cluster-binding NifX family protein
VRLAISHHEGRLSPVFDVAGGVLLVDVENGQEVSREERPLSRTDLAARAEEFRKLGANVLICGAISAPLEALLVSSGVRIIGFRCGLVDELITAFLEGTVAKPRFWMPGCSRQSRHEHRLSRKERVER